MYEFSIYIASIFAAILILTLVFKVKMEHIERFGTLATAIATMLLAIATIYLAWNAGQQLVEIRSAATQTNEIISSYQRIAKSGEALLVASQRAWVSCNVVMGDDLTYDVNGARFTLGCVFNNTGHSPARQVHFQASVNEDIRWDPQAEQNRVCAAAETRIGSDVFPGEPVASVTVAYIPDHKLKELQKELGETLHYNAAIDILPVVVTCIGYRIIGDEKYHHTPRILSLSRQNKTINISDGTVPKSQITLKIWPLQEAVAD
jgi:hypothetical protein